jgi:hypothetical protein
MEATTAIRRIGRTVRPPARCKRGTAQPTTERTHRNDRNAFLKHQFKPFWAYSGNRNRAEREFLCSLSHLCKHYDLPIPETVNGGFPQNIYQAWQAVSQKLKTQDKQLECIIAGDERHTAILATVNRYDTGMCLYYIPVRPVCYWVQNSQSQKLAELLLSVFAYLHQVVRVPFYTEPDSYVGCQYQMMEDWVNDDQEDEGYRDAQLDELYTMHNAGLKLHTQISKPEYVERFADTVGNFNPADDWEKDWLCMADEFLQLYRQYPERSIFDHIHSGLLYPEDEDRISADQYISFYWSGNGELTDTLFETVDCNFQEIAYMDEPMHLQKFDRLPETVIPDFEFENRLFDLLNKLAKRLNDHDHEQCEPTI